MAYSDYTTALAAFHASPSDTTKRAVMTARAALPVVSADGAAVSLPTLSELEATLEGALAASRRSDRRRFIRTQVSHGA